MTRIPRLLGWWLLLVLTACAHAPPRSGSVAQNPPLLILVSIDGYRADYLDRGITPNIAALAARGVRAESMRPAFPALTFPNHYTMVTGLYPDYHGIVNNNLEDPARPGVTFTMKTSSDPFWWNQATPIWVTAQNQGLHTASMFWPASDIPIHGVRAEHTVPFDETVPPDQRVDTVLGWLDLPAAERPAFAMLYFNQVDHEGHEHGPDSPEVNAALRQIDEAVGRLVDGLKQRGLFDRANLILVADHGMESTAPDRVIYMDELIDLKSIHVEAAGTLTGLRAEPGHEAEVERILLKPHDHMQCWRKADVLARFHYGTNPRVPPILCLANRGWTISSHDYVATHKFSVGQHGFDNFDPHMGALFVAEGPAFRQGMVHKTFDNVDVYPLLAHLLGLTPEKTDGRFSDVADMLQPPGM